MSISDSFASILHKLIRLYTLYFPFSKGKYRLIQALRRAFPQYARPLLATASDGRTFVANLSTGMYDTIFFLGEYESFLTTIITRVVKEGDVCIDAGANFGWYTTLLASRVGDEGRVHAFEPVPSTFAELSRNVTLNEHAENTVLNEAALSDSRSTATVTLFDAQPTGHASLAGKGKGARIDCKTVNLDNYLVERKIDNVAFMKVDVEGAELDLLRGSERTFHQKVPPVIVMEMALEQSRHFGYLPNDLIEFIASRAWYDFFKIDEVGEFLVQIEHFEANDIGANVLCVPRAANERVRNSIQDLLRTTNAG